MLFNSPAPTNAAARAFFKCWVNTIMIPSFSAMEQAIYGAQLGPGYIAAAPLRRGLPYALFLIPQPPRPPPPP